MADSNKASWRALALRALGVSTPAPSEPTIKSNIWGSDYFSFIGGQSDSPGVLSAYSDAPTVEPYIYRCMDVRGNAISQVPLACWTKDAQGRDQKVTHPVLDLLETTNSQSYVDGVDTLMRFTLGGLDLYGYCAWKLAFNGRQFPTEIFWLAPGACTPLHGYEVRGPDGKPSPLPFGGIRYSSQTQITYTPDEIVYFVTDNFGDAILGTSKIEVLKRAIALRSDAQASNENFFKNSMRPDWILSGSFSNTQDNIDRIKRQLQRHFSGESNRAPLVIGEGMSAHLLTTSHSDAEWVQQMRLVQEEVTGVFGVPLIYLNNLERSTYDNAKTSKLMFWHDTMIPESKKLAKLLTRRLLWRYWPETTQKVELGFDYSKIEGLGEDVNLVWERFQKFMTELDKQVINRTLTPNQARTILEGYAGELGVDPKPWSGDVYANAGLDGSNLGDTHIALSTYVPVQQLSEQARINEMAARGANPDLIESVPGAPNASTNVSALIARTTAQQQAANEAAAARLEATRQAQTPPAQPPIPPTGTPSTDEPTATDAPKALTIEEFKEWGELMGKHIDSTMAAHLAALTNPLVIHKAPHPVKVREVRLGKVQDKLTKALKSHFQKLQTESLRTLRSRKAAAVDPDQELFSQSKSHAAMLPVVTTGITEAAAAAYAASAEDYGLTTIWDANNPWLDTYMGTRIPLIKGIDQTTADRLKAALTEGAKAGESMDELASRVTDVFSAAIDSRSLMIARTETIQAYGRASIQSYRDAGLTEVELYDGTDDPECAARNGETMSLDDAEQEMSSEHPSGTLTLAPVVDITGDGEDEGKVVGPGIESKAYDPEPKDRPDEHLHDYGQNTRPVLGFDLHGTLTPDFGFPLVSAPFPGVQEWLSLMASRGCCIHISSASMDVTDKDVRKARRDQIEGWAVKWNLPVGYITPNTEAAVRIDDRGVTIPPDPDWLVELPAIFEAKILAGPWLLEDGVYVRNNLNPVGDVVDVPPSLDVLPQDRPRGYTTQTLDFDLHRTLSPAWGSSREAPFDPDGVALVNSFYGQGYQIQISCGGWSTARNDDKRSDDRLAIITQQLLAAGVRFDRIVSKEDCDIWGDDKVLTFTGDWATLGAAILARVGPPVSMPAHYHSATPPGVV